jgi:hypothetical protein
MESGVSSFNYSSKVPNLAVYHHLHRLEPMLYRVLRLDNLLLVQSIQAVLDSDSESHAITASTRKRLVSRILRKGKTDVLK